MNDIAIGLIQFWLTLKLRDGDNVDDSLKHLAACATLYSKRKAATLPSAMAMMKA